MATGIIIGVILAQWAGGLSAQPSDGGIMWRWSNQPSMMDRSHAFERAGLTKADEGQWAVVECTVAPGGRLTDCGVLEERDLNSDMGRAILLMTRNFRAATTDRGGQPTAGRKVQLSAAYGGQFQP